LPNELWRPNFRYAAGQIEPFDDSPKDNETDNKGFSAFQEQSAKMLPWNSFFFRSPAGEGRARTLFEPDQVMRFGMARQSGYQIIAGAKTR